MISMLREEKLKAEFKTKEHKLMRKEKRLHNSIARQSSPFTNIKSAIKYLDYLDPPTTDQRSSTLSNFSMEKIRQEGMSSSLKKKINKDLDTERIRIRQAKNLSAL